MLLNALTPVLALALALPTWGCDSCYGPYDVTMTRNVRRMQPDALASHTKPRGPLEWGQLNFLHTTDTHGWLEGHLKEQNYGADWGDFTSFAKRMKEKAQDYGVELLLVDTGDLHDGAGLSDATSPNGRLSNPVFENIDYDLLTIGNHELYVTEIAYETFNQFSKVYGERYLTSNVEIFNPSTGKFEYIGHKYRYFTTPKGVRIMSFGVLYDFTGNSNVSRVTTAATMVQQAWFQKAIRMTDVDLFLVIGHNPARPSDSESSLDTVYNAIRKVRPHKPIQFFGGHSHIRDFVVYDAKATALESGRYCETLGWLAINGLRRGARTNKIPSNVPQATRHAVVPSSSATASPAHAQAAGVSMPLYARRYIDWNRLSFAYHAKDSQSDTFNTNEGVQVTDRILQLRKQLRLRKLYGCAPHSYCESCRPFGDPRNIFTVLKKALETTVVNKTRSSIPRLILINSGGIRFDLIQGPFTYDDSFIVSPFTDKFQYLPKVPYAHAKKVLHILNTGNFGKRQEERELNSRDFNFTPLTDLSDACAAPPSAHHHLSARGPDAKPLGRIIRRQNTKLTPGYTTTDDFGKNGDDTIHSSIPYYNQPNIVQANASFPTDGSTPQVVDLVFIDYIASSVLTALKQAGSSYTAGDVSYYLPQTFTTNSYLPAYAKVAPAWQKNVPNCPVGEGVLG